MEQVRRHTHLEYSEMMKEIYFFGLVPLLSYLGLIMCQMEIKPYYCMCPPLRELTHLSYYPKQAGSKV